MQIRVLGDEGGKEAAEAQSETDDVFLKKIEATMLTQVHAASPQRSHMMVYCVLKLDEASGPGFSCLRDAVLGLMHLDADGRRGAAAQDGRCHQILHPTPSHA